MTHVEFPAHGSHVRRGPETTNLDLLAGVVTGQIAGLIMAFAMIVVFVLILGTAPWFPVQVIGSVVYGDQALHGFQWSVFLTGLALHQGGASLLWGLIFGAVAHVTHAAHAERLWMLAIGTGVVSQILDVHLLMPAYMKSMFGHNIWAENVPMVWSWVAHLVFGAAFTIYPTVRRALAPRLA